MYRIVLDTETLGDVEDNKSIMVYDFGYVVLDHECNIVETHRYLVKEVFCDRAADMLTAYYANKLPEYHLAVCDGSLSVKPFIEIWQQFKKICANYDVKQIWAHNARFDRDALNNTIEILSNGFVRFFTPYGVDWKCTCAAAGETFCNSRNYFKFAAEHGFVSASGNVRTTAEAIYAYLTNNPDFVEEHTALSDVLIETEILRKALKQHKKMTATPSRMAWRHPQKKFKEWAAN